MRDLFYAEALNANFGGRQDLIRGDGTAASTSNVTLSTLSLIAGTNYFPIDTGGNSSLRVVLTALIVQPPVPQTPGISTSTSGGTGLAAATQYFYKVTATLPGGETGPSAEVNVTTGAGGTNSNTVTWASVANATGYTVYRGTATNAENVGYVVAGGGTVTFLDTGAAGSAISPPAQPVAATASIQPTFNDRQTPDTTVAAVPVTLTPGTATTATLTLTGQRIVLLAIVVPPRGLCTVSRAEYSAK